MPTVNLDSGVTTLIVCGTVCALAGIIAWIACPKDTDLQKVEDDEDEDK